MSSKRQRSKEKIHPTECRVPENSKERLKKKKKSFLNDECKEIEENNRMGKTRDLFHAPHMTQSVKNLPAMQETWVPFLG